ncbi:MAG: FAD-binding protein [Nitriliruptor sp.]|uniref:L-aspartate oxidase n=1 Tax=Nitriliruptor sp. TaxID=2448056 RepID=UPI0034A064F0
MNAPSIGGPPPAPPIDGGRATCDVLIIGAGLAGLYAAVSLPDHLDVIVVDKGVPGGDSGSSPWAQGGLAAALGPDDSPAAHAEDTIIAGDGLCDPVAVDVLTREAPQHVLRLLELGAVLDRHHGGDVGGVPVGTEAAELLPTLSLAREGGQRVARSVRRADATGAELMRVLRLAAAPRVSRLAGIVRSLARDPAGSVTGAHVLTPDGPVAVHARATVLATGGCGGLFAATTNPDNATGDGLALAVAAGAAVRDVEFVQFHPTGLAVSGTWRFLLTEALRGAGATLHAEDGTRFLVGRHPDAELAPRHVVAKAILEQPDGTAWLDATGLGHDVLVHEFPTVLGGARQHGFDLATERVPVTPAAHYHVGGVRTDLHGRTSVLGLYACGEVASTGLHGANRMASNSLSEAVVFGARTARALAEELPDAVGDLGPAPPVGTGSRSDVAELRRQLRALMSTGAGPVRDGAALAATASQLAAWRTELGHPGESPEEIELHHGIRTSELIVGSARLRTESRGGHWREDHPHRDPAWDGVHLERTPATP